MAHRRRIAAKLLVLGLCIGTLPSLACGYAIITGAALLYSGGGGGGTTQASGAADLAPPNVLNDRFVGALVVPNGVTIGGFELRIGGTLVPVDFGVPIPQQQQLAQELVQRGILDAANEYALFLQTSTSVLIQDGTPIEVRFTQTGTQTGQPPVQSDVGFGGTRLADLLDGLPLADFQAHDDPIAATISTVSELGRALLVAGLVAAASFALARQGSSARQG